MVRIAAASDLKFALDEVAAAFLAAGPNVLAVVVVKSTQVVVETLSVTA